MSKTIHVLNGAVSLAQPDGGFQTSIDAVLLAAACPVVAEQSVLDLGCGVGAAGLCVAQRVLGIALTGVELFAREAELARQNAADNGANAMVVEGDIRDIEFEDRFDHVVCNPPYLTAGAHLHSPDEAKATAMGHVDREASLSDWVMAAHRNLKSKGSFTLVHRADALDEILVLLGKRFGAIEVIPLWPKAGREAKRVIVRALKDRKSPLKLHAGVTLHQDNGNYTQEAEAILREGKGLYL